MEEVSVARNSDIGRLCLELWNGQFFVTERVRERDCESICLTYDSDVRIRLLKVKVDGKSIYVGNNHPRYGLLLNHYEALLKEKGEYEDFEDSQELRLATPI